MIVHDVICPSGHFTKDLAVILDSMPLCPVCDRMTVVCWYGGKPPGTDVLGHAHYSSALGIEYTSTRDRDKQMAAKGMQPGSNVRGGPMTQGQRLPKRFTPTGYEHSFEWKGKP